MNTNQVATPLSGHASAETAHVTADYPYGFRLRCQRRVWVETHPKKGSRLVVQTSNPKRPGLVWNKPKASTYAVVRVIYLDEQGHVSDDSLGVYCSVAEVEAFSARYEACLSATDRALVGAIHKLAAKREELNKKADAQRAGGATS